MNTSKLYTDSDEETIEALFVELNDTLRRTGQADFSVLERCPIELRQELQSLMNVAALTYRAFHPAEEEDKELSRRTAS